MTSFVKYYAGIFGIALMCGGCSISGSITDRAHFEIVAQDMKLEDEQTLRIMHGTTVREVPLSGIADIEIMPEISTVVASELFYGARIVLKNEGALSSAQKNSDSTSERVYLSVNNTIRAKTKDATVLVPLDNIFRLTIK